jgi:hypothetical protein
MAADLDCPGQCSLVHHLWNAHTQQIGGTGGRCVIETASRADEDHRGIGLDLLHALLMRECSRS